tara:strand:- start:2218 stop:2505 length:288 start_codon:yes stop_codon:yes gene_type:complete
LIATDSFTAQTRRGWIPAQGRNDGGHDTANPGHDLRAEARATRELIKQQGGRVLLVTHQVNISALTGEFTRSGEVLVIRAKAGDIEGLGSILIEP